MMPTPHVTADELPVVGEVIIEWSYKLDVVRIVDAATGEQVGHLVTDMFLHVKPLRPVYADLVMCTDAEGDWHIDRAVYDPESKSHYSRVFRWRVIEMNVSDVNKGVPHA